MPAASLTRLSMSGLLELAQLEAEREVVVDRHVRVERVALEDHRDVAVLRRHVVDDPVADEHPPVADVLEPGHAAQCGGLSAARWPDEDQELPVLDLQVEVVDGDDVLAVPLVHVVECDGRHRSSSLHSQRQAAGGLVAHAREGIIVRCATRTLPDSIAPMQRAFRFLRRSAGRLTDLRPSVARRRARPRRRATPKVRRGSAVAGRARRSAITAGSIPASHRRAAPAGRPAKRPARSDRGHHAPPIAEHRRLPAAAEAARVELARPMAAHHARHGSARDAAGGRPRAGR